MLQLTYGADIEITRQNLGTHMLGSLITKHGFTCVTLELPDDGNKPDISCIPPGLYKYKYRADGSNGECLQLISVVGRTYVQMHKGNWLKNTLGCILPGVSYKATSEHGPMVTSSKPTLTKILAKAGNTGTIYIK